ncbi:MULTISPECIES: NYN domain-containing protein [unclassified Microbacterium]|uniref:NYN domain-containing protein n=1 Tax=unclassified Microbacterium TaxID=2609290 RepID=UPI000EAA778F|nr:MULTISPECIES: NYN domain-containing protein [unclassified Microbacterium]MBT2486866.1 NYN domain-containing protein [Microbacterium sp. ISL-108]RKN64785.1 NYN domain-containing protein [Microbacterium sp. CGR2]
MAETTDARVAVYLDFDNIVISWYDRVHGRNSYGKDRQRITENPNDPDVVERLGRAMIEVGAIIDYAASFGTLVLTRAYADWSSPVNAVYRSQLVARAVDLVQLFPAAAYAKNGADIRLAVDAVEDMFRLPDLTHVVIVAGDSDYVPLAQRCKRLGRYVIGVGVAGSTAKSLAAACDEFEAYDSLPGVVRPSKPAPATAAPAAPAVDDSPEAGEESAPETTTKAKTSRRRAKTPAAKVEEQPATKVDDQEEATKLLERALRLGHDKADADEWLHSSAVKTHMRRMDPSFSEKALGYRSFSDFLKSREEITELEETGHERLVRLRDL